ncbi:hypothetical protein [Zhongshania aquimaris]|uniref:Uncharacterized protein n=1 Tax=Zhongshania aquimaris TaxID=2857107 RepID=A0ABS6VQA7_9GAMM|nr:hypothetical protein [Zhongshania aquimaris]MBW2940503.1 hypothetical protein [Zhongshania aquimaris]
MSERIDAEELLTSGQLTQEWLRESGIATVKPVDLFVSLYEQTRDYIAQGVNIDDAQFTVAELNALLKGKKEGEDSADVARKYVVDNLKKYQELVAEHRESLDAYLRKHKQSQRVVISSTESQGRHKKHYFLKLEPLDGDDGETQTVPKIDPRYVQYRVKQLPRPWLLARPFMALTLVGWRRTVFLAGIFVLVLALGGPIVHALVIRKLLLLHLYIIIVSAGVFYVVRPIYDVIERSILIAPDWMSGFTVPSAQLELREVGTFESGRAIRQIRLAVYEGECPICGGSINVEDGKGEFKGRLIGECSRARAEHIYSFDHISKVGVPLRKNGYYQPKV